jgi:trehalose/maltose hydrolase-like predicted phosphorylase
MVGARRVSALDAWACRPNGVLRDRPVVDSDADGWCLVVEDGPAGLSRVFESLLTVADGVTGTRGSLEEDGSEARPAVFVAGVYQRDEQGAESLLAMPSWATLAPRDLPLAGERILDLRTGVLWRMCESDAEVMLTARWACLGRSGCNVLVAEGSSEVLDVASGREAAEVRTSTGGGVATIVETTLDQATVGAAANGRQVLRVATFEAEPRRRASARRAAARHEEAWAAGPEALLAEQKAAWAARWAEADVEVVGDVELTRAVRLALFHLMSSATDQAEAAVAARGLTGPAYSGHVFWDADVFVLPALAATHPSAARAMLEYRIRRLPAARHAAAEAQKTGARFPWESGHDGRDITPRSGIDDRGQLVAIRTGDMEEHITADVAWAAWHFAAWAGRWRFLEGRGRPLVIETARYWASRVRTDATGRAHLDGVIGPDEYHDGVDDNAFTNHMAAWNLERAAELVERFAGRAALGDADELGEAHQWRKLAHALVDGYDPASGRHVQFAGFDDLEPLLVTDVGPVPVAADLVLRHARIASSQIIKQADVLMLHHLLPDAGPPGSLARDMDHYLPRTAHGSSLSPAVHASLLARLGRLDEAVAFLDIAQRVDLEDVTGTTAGGLHLATLGGLWQALVMGFGGVRVARPDDDALTIDPHIPDHWDELRLRIRWHGNVVQLRCRADRVHVRCAAPVRVRLGTAAGVGVPPPGRWLVRDSRPLGRRRVHED